MSVPLIIAVVVVLLVLYVVARSFHRIGDAQFGLVSKNFGKQLPEGSRSPIALHGEAGFQPDMLMPGWRFKLWPIYRVSVEERIQIPMGAVGVVISQVGDPLPVGAKTAAYKTEFGDFRDLRAFIEHGGQVGVQRPVLAQGTSHLLHPVAFVVVTKGRIYGRPLSEDIKRMAQNLSAEQLSVTRIGSARPDGKDNTIGLVTTLEGPPLPSGDIAGRIGGYEDVKELEAANAGANEVIQLLMGTKNNLHHNYQDFQAFLDNGGCVGLQQDPLLDGEYNLNPYCVSVEIVPMLVVEQGQVAVIKSYVGLPSEDTSGSDYKFGSIVAPGHRGLWSEPLRTGKYPLNPRCYQAVMVPTSILTLNWARAVSEAHDLDRQLSPIDAKSKDAFAFKIDLQVLIHIPDTNAPKVIGMVGTMLNLANEVLQSAVGNYVRSALQERDAMIFIQDRKSVQASVENEVRDYLGQYNVEVPGVYIQDVVYPDDLVKVRTEREIANQQRTTYATQQQAQQARIDLEQQRGMADAQASLAASKVSIDIKENEAKAAVAAAKGEAQVIKTTAEAEAERTRVTGEAEASATKAKGLATAAAYEAQKEAIGPEQTARVAIVEAMGNAHITKVVPDTVVGGDGAQGGLMNLLMGNLVTAGTTNGHKPDANQAPAEAATQF